MYLTTPLEDIYSVDIEGDPIPSTVVWCACVINARTREVERFRPHEMDALKNRLQGLVQAGKKILGHNFLGYDAPTLNRLIGTSIGVSSVIDTMIMSMVYDPSLEGGHSLRSWGQRLKDNKLEFDDFSRFTEEQLVYCEQDTMLTIKVYLALRKKMLGLGFEDKGLEIEHRAWVLKDKQTRTGFAFDIREAELLYAKLRSLQKDIEDDVYTNHWPPSLECVAEYKRPFKKDGSHSINYGRHCEQYERVEVADDRATYRCFDYVYFDIGSPAQRVEKLLELGWKHGPREVTKTGKPRPTNKGKLAPSLEAFVESSGNQGVRLIVDWMNVNYLGNMVNTWMEAYNPETGAIHGQLFLANTLRYKHSAPNTANIPAVRIGPDDQPLRGAAGGYTYEARGLWVCREPSRRSLVGVDAAGIQLRGLAHHLNNETFTRNILSSDPHAANQTMWGLSSRALAKTICYATLMGAGDARIATEARVSLAEAKEAKAKFFESVPELPGLIRKLQAEWNRTGRISLCSGNKILVPRDYTVIPYLLQGDESQIMKQAMIFIAAEIKKHKIDAMTVGFIHDENQLDCLTEDVPRLLPILDDCFKRAGEAFNYNIPIACSYSVGKNWSQTH